MPRGRKHGAQSWPSMGALHRRQGGPASLGGPRVGGRRRRRWCPVSPRAPNRPNQSSRGPPCGDSQEQPGKWCTSPNAGLLPATPHISGQVSGPKTLNRNDQPPTFSLQDLTFPWDKNVLGPSREELVENQLPRPHEELSSSTYGPKIPFPLLFPEPSPR